LGDGRSDGSQQGAYSGHGNSIALLVEKVSAKMNPSYRKFILFSFMLLALSSVFSTACKHKQVALPPPVPTPVPVIPNGSIVFVQRGHLVRLDLDASQTTPLTSGKSTEWYPSCSPKGDQVVYWSNAVDTASDSKSETGVYNLWKINLDGSNRVQITFDETNSLKTSDQNLLVNDAPTWSFDGKKILYSIEGDIWMMDSDGFNPESVLLGHSALCPQFSPDGKSVMFITNADDTVYNIWTVTLPDKSLKKLTTYTDWNVGSPTFSMDGKKILFNLYRGDSTQVYTINSADGLNPLNLTNNGHSLCPKFAQNDRKILYSSYGTGDDVGLDIYMANSNGTESKSLTLDGGASPSWAPARILLAPASVPTVALPTPIGK
jgi:Tol biopolymer transport system component